MVKSWLNTDDFALQYFRTPLTIPRSAPRVEK
jgi:hypothetical protein